MLRGFLGLLFATMPMLTISIGLRLSGRYQASGGGGGGASTAGQPIGLLLSLTKAS